MPSAQAEALLAYLQANPDAAKAAHAQVGNDAMTLEFGRAGEEEV